MIIWAREWKNNHMLRDCTVEDYSEDTRTHKIFHALDEVCSTFDLSHPETLPLPVYAGLLCRRGDRI